MSDSPKFSSLLDRPIILDKWIEKNQTQHSKKISDTVHPQYVFKHTSTAYLICT
jgi:hypothetical protein